MPHMSCWDGVGWGWGGGCQISAYDISLLIYFYLAATGIRFSAISFFSASSIFFSWALCVLGGAQYHGDLQHKLTFLVVDLFMCMWCFKSIYVTTHRLLSAAHASDYLCCGPV